MIAAICLGCQARSSTLASTESWLATGSLTHLCAAQAEEDAFPMYSSYVGTDDIPTEVPVVEDSDGPSWFFVVSALT